jgi:NAD(P)-dependent dehydrogenase (short-subunit alcohol dehydrogenase family)
MKLAGKKALITGGNRGIGLATARLFVAEGAQVAITGRDQTTLDEATAELGPSARGYRADVTIAEESFSLPRFRRAVGASRKKLPKPSSSSRRTIPRTSTRSS